MSEISALPANIFLNDTPIENIVEPLKVNLEDIKMEVDLEHPLARVDVKCEIPETCFMEEPSCSQWLSNLDTNSNSVLKTDVSDGECSNARSMSNDQIKCEPPDSNIKHEILSRHEDSSLTDSNNIILSSSVKVESEDIGIKNDSKHVENTLGILNNKELGKTQSFFIECSICKVQIKSTLMNGHLRQHYFTIFKCTKCPYKTLINGALVRHRKKVHSTDTHPTHIETPMFQCTLCKLQVQDKIVMKKHLETHQREKLNSGFQCPFCPFKSSIEYHLKQHLGEKNNAQYFCEFCKFQTPCICELRQHTLKHGARERKKAKILQPEVEKTTQTLAENRRKPENLQLSNSTSEEVKKDQAKSRIKLEHSYHKPEPEVKLVELSVMTFQCKFCVFKTIDRTALEDHLKLAHDHNMNVEFQCTFCPFKTTTMRSLQQHLDDNKFDGIGTMKCKLCEFKSAYRCEFIQHAIVVHNHSLPIETPLF